MDTASDTGVGTVVRVDADEVGAWGVTSSEPMVPVTVGLDSAAGVTDGVVTASVCGWTVDVVAAMVSAVCDEFLELLATSGEDAEMLDDEVSGAAVVPVVAEGPLVTDELVLEGPEEAVVEDPLVPLVVVVPPEEVVVVEPVLPPLEDTDVVGAL